MSASHEWTDWHLTPRGWEEGTCRVDFGKETERPIPADRVLTCRYDEYLGSVYGKWHRTTEERWRSDDASQIETLLRQYGECPRKL